jgi:hypothetical protein
MPLPSLHLSCKLYRQLQHRPKSEIEVAMTRVPDPVLSPRRDVRAPRLKQEESERLYEVWIEFRRTLEESPKKALSVYETAMRDATTEIVQQSTRQLFGSTVRWIKDGAHIGIGVEALPKLTEQYGRARRGDRRVLVKSIRDELIDLGDPNRMSEERRNLLRAIGHELPRFVLTGTVAQQLVCKLAVHIGLAPDVPCALVDAIGKEMLEAMKAVLEIGAPATRDIAVEGLGAMLKLFDNPQTLVETPANPGVGDDEVNEGWIQRFKRRRLVALAIAGHQDSVDEFFHELAQDIRGGYDRRADLLRALPPLWRQRKTDPGAMRDRCVGFLCSAASVLHPGERQSPQLLISFARFQESIFRTIETMIVRNAPAKDFDDVVAAAVRNIPPTLFVTADLANAQTRATVAIIGTAAQIVSRVPGSRCEEALKKHFLQLGEERSPWANPGVIEGCFNTLPYLLGNPDHNDWTQPALDALLLHLRTSCAMDDLVAMHRRLFANACFRRLLIAIQERVHQKLSEFHTASEEELRGEEADHAVSMLLARPDAELVLEIFQAHYDPVAAAAPPPVGISEVVIGAVAFEADLLRRNAELFREWEVMLPERRLLLTRIFGAQLRALSHEAREIRRYPHLQTLLDMPTVTLTEEQRQVRLLEFLSDIPSGAAEAADADLQDFVERHCGRSKRDVDDLPGYVLAMISDDVSYRLAADIAREIDLDLRRKRLADPAHDFAAALYQVMLRGPNRRIFDHLVPRMVDDDDRKLVLLFRRHVEAIDRWNRRALDMPDLVEYVTCLIKELSDYRGDTLLNLAKALRLYVDLVPQRNDAIWRELMYDAKTGRGVRALFKALDDIAGALPAAHGADRAPRHESKADAMRSRNERISLVERCEEECTTLRAKVALYVELEVNQFEERAAALRAATDQVRRIEERLASDRALQPPERVMLHALLRSWHDLFTRTDEHFVDDPRHCVETTDPVSFWQKFVGPFVPPRTAAPPPSRFFVKLRRRLAGKVDAALKVGVPDEPHVVAGVPRPTDPPPYPDQWRKFEKFYVEWMEAELDIDHLKWALMDRWPFWFRAAYRGMTSLGWTVAFIAAPFLVAFVMHATKHCSVEGAGYFAVAAVFVVLALLNLAMLTRKRGDLRRIRQYRFPCLLPPLFRLIVVPLALIVDFDHSYYFPIFASSAVLVLLMTLGFLTTRFFVTRELLGHDSDRMPTKSGEQRTRERRRVRQIIAVAMGHSFALSLLFSIMFEANTVPRLAHEQAASQETHSSGGPAVHSIEAPLFLGLFPRDARFDVGRIAMRFGWTTMPERWQQHVRMEFYPTLVLTWTALGLFFGVFLEGFLKGERLRVKMKR